MPEHTQISIGAQVFLRPYSAFLQHVISCQCQSLCRFSQNKVMIRVDVYYPEREMSPANPNLVGLSARSLIWQQPNSMKDFHVWKSGTTDYYFSSPAWIAFLLYADEI